MMTSRPFSQPEAEPNKRTYTVREGEDREDMFYLKWQWDHYFGLDMDGPEYLPLVLADVLGWVDEDEQPIATCTPVAEHERVHIGGAVASLEGHEECVDELPEGHFDGDALAGDRNAWLWLNVVDPNWRGHGIGRDLFEYRLRWARAQGADMVFGYGWERDGQSSRPLFEGYGFVPVQRFEQFYSDQSTRDSCPDCGVWPDDDRECDCGATLWALDGSDIDVR